MKETELTFYAPIGDFDGFDQAAATEIQTQYKKKGKEGFERVRKTIKDGEEIYELTVKSYTDNDMVRKEASVKITPEFYRAWLRVNGDKGVSKIRYTFLTKKVELSAGGESFRLPELKYEVDVFLDEKGSRSKWCKVDIELDSILPLLKDKKLDLEDVGFKVVLSELPINLDVEKAFSGNDMSEEQEKAVESFWEKFSHGVRLGREQH